MTVLSKNPRCQECGLPIYPGVDHYCPVERDHDDVELSGWAVCAVALMLILFWLCAGRCAL